MYGEKMIVRVLGRNGSVFVRGVSRAAIEVFMIWEIKIIDLPMRKLPSGVAGLYHSTAL